MTRLLDADGDGKVTREEFLKGAARLPAYKDDPEKAKNLFETLDKDKDGALTGEELKALGRGR